jgi:hypothetical protein
MEASKKDKYFASPLESIQPFNFNAEVAEVFDDMVTRSVPLTNSSPWISWPAF